MSIYLKSTTKRMVNINLKDCFLENDSEINLRADSLSLISLVPSFQVELNSILADFPLAATCTQHASAS